MCICWVVLLLPKALVLLPQGERELCASGLLAIWQVPQQPGKAVVSQAEIRYNFTNAPWLPDSDWRHKS